MGARAHMSPRLLQILPAALEFGYIGRPERASPGEGYPAAHTVEQNRIIRTALDLSIPVSVNPGQAARRALANVRRADARRSQAACRELLRNRGRNPVSQSADLVDQEAPCSAGCRAYARASPAARRWPSRAHPRDRRPVGRDRLRRGPQRCCSASATRAATPQGALDRDRDHRQQLDLRHPPVEQDATATAAARSTAAAPTPGNEPCIRSRTTSRRPRVRVRRRTATRRAASRPATPPARRSRPTRPASRPA